jgi:hypothetical protein
MSRRLTLVTVVLSIAAMAGAVHAQSQIAVDALPSAPASAPVRPAAESDQPLVQIAILLDNSGSMSGLIEQAKSELWRVVNELTTAKQNGKQPRLRVALYTYGDPPPRQLSPLSDDLDKVSEALFAVKISGGSEFCGQVIQTATRDLGWSANPNDLKLIFIAGNEPFSQGPVDYHEACKDAITAGIIVNTIHCGNGIPDGWRDGALLADGKAMNINQNVQVAYVEAPQDKEIAKLGVELNKTYIAYGAHAGEGQQRQMEQDSNAIGQSQSSSLQRAVSKANGYYRNSAWDLVDAITDGKVELSKIKEEDLPENMRKMKVDERKKFVEQQGVERRRVQERINTLNGERNKYVADKRKEMAAESGEKTLDQVLVEAIRTQAKAKSFEFAEGGS